MPPGRGLVVGWVSAVVALSAIARAQPEWLMTFAASPDRVTQGKLWYLVTSGLLVDRPIVISIVCFVVLATLALLVSGTRVFWWSAFLGQIVATLVVYALITAVRAIVPAAFESVMTSPDYGVSAISAAWLGSVATVGWRRRGHTRSGRVSIAVSCVAVGLFAYTLRPDINILSSEHLVAFALGVAAALPGFAARRGSPWHHRLAVGRSMLSPNTNPHRGRIGVALLAPLAVAIVGVPVGVAALRDEIALRLRPTVTRCILDWNTLTSAPRTLAAPTTRVVLTTLRVTVLRNFGGQVRPPHRIDYCRYVLAGTGEVTTVLGRWHHGRVDTWTVTKTPAGVAPRPGNAAVGRGGRLRLRYPRGPRLILSS